MAKTVAPLQSFSASGKIGKSIVFFSHLGRNVVRGLVTPANPQTAGQGDSRLLLGSIGRAAKVVVNPSDWYTDAKQVVPAGQTWVSYFIRNVTQIYGSGQTGVDALTTAADAHTKAAIFESEAAALGLTDLVISYATDVDTITAGNMLYALAAHTMAMAGSNPSLFDRTPYTTALADWDTADIQAFVADLQTVA